MTRSSLRGPVFRASTLLLAVFFVLLVAACDSPEEKEARHLARGIEFAEAGDDAKAMIELRNVLRLNAKNAEAYFQMGLIHERAERWPQAFNAFQSATAERPDHVAAWIKYGTLALMGGELEALERATSSLGQIAPENPDALALEAALLARRDDIERARLLATEILEQHPDHVRGRTVLAGLLASAGRPEEALELIEEGLALTPESVELRGVKILLLDSLGDSSSLMTVFAEMIELEPQEPEHRLGLMRYQLARADLVGARATLEDMLAAGVQDQKIVPDLIELIYTIDGFDAAEARTKSLIAQNPEDHGLVFLLVGLYRAEDLNDPAEAVLMDLLDTLAPDTGEQQISPYRAQVLAEAHVELGRLRLAAGDSPGAQAQAEAAIKLRSSHPGGNVLRGVLHLRAGELDDAVRRARSALAEAAGYVPALRLLAEAHLAKGETPIGIDVLGQAHELDPGDHELGVRLARLLSSRGDDDAAYRIWSRMLDAGHDPATALAARAEIAIRQQSWLSAEADVSQLMELPEGAAAGATMTARLLEARARYQESRNWYARAVELDPDDSTAFIGIVRTHLAAGELPEALQSLSDRIGRYPDDQIALALRGEILAGEGQVAEAEESFRAAIDVRPDWSNPYRQLGVLLFNQGRHEEAFGVYRQGLAIIPNDVRLNLDLAQALMLIGDHQAAIDSYAAVLELDPGQVLAANNFAALVADFRYQDQQALDQALAIAQRFRDSSDPILLDTLGWLLHRGGDSGALRVLERAAVYAPDVPVFAYHLAVVRAAAGDENGARAALQIALAESAGYPGIEDAQSLRVRLERPQSTKD